MFVFRVSGRKMHHHNHHYHKQQSKPLSRHQPRAPVEPLVGAADHQGVALAVALHARRDAQAVLGALFDVWFRGVCVVYIVCF